MSIARSHAAALAQDTLRIIERGHYTSPSGQTIEIGGLLRQAVRATQSYPPEAALPGALPGQHQTSLSVTNESTLAAARRLAEAGLSPAALNFASARHPGGGFEKGARAQEESLARSSGLYACIAGDPMYARHQASSDALYTSSAIYSPGVPVFRDDHGALLERPYLCGFITAPAVNAGVVLERDRTRRPAIRAAMWERICKVLAIGALHGHPALVLGAWGCGVFRNDPQEVAELFAQALGGPFHGAFASVVFAVLDQTDDQHFIGPFRRLLGG